MVQCVNLFATSYLNDCISHGLNIHTPVEQSNSHMATARVQCQHERVWPRAKTTQGEAHMDNADNTHKRHAEMHAAHDFRVELSSHHSSYLSLNPYYC